jgi:hypothetical protein
LNKAQRLNLFYQRLAEAESCASFNEAYDLLHKTMNEVEDEFSTIPFDATYPMNSERMYAPLMDNAKPIDQNLTRFRNRFNYCFMSKNGAILITDLQFNPQLTEKVK